MATEPRLSRLAVVATAAEMRAIDGNTTQNTGVGLRIETERPRTDLEAPRAVTPSPTVRPVPGNKLEGRAAISRATAAEGPLQATGPVAQRVATGLAAEAERTA